METNVKILLMEAETGSVPDLNRFCDRFWDLLPTPLNFVCIARLFLQAPLSLLISFLLKLSTISSVPCSQELLMDA